MRTPHFWFPDHFQCPELVVAKTELGSFSRKLRFIDSAWCPPSILPAIQHWSVIKRISFFPTCIVQLSTHGNQERIEYYDVPLPREGQYETKTVQPYILFCKFIIVPNLLMQLNLQSSRKMIDNIFQSQSSFSHDAS